MPGAWASSVIATRRSTVTRLGPKLRDEIGEGDVEKQHAAFGVIDDVFDLLRKQPGIDGMQHGADPGDREVELHVAMRVPGERRDPIARLHAEPDQRLRELRGARPQAGVIGAVERPFAGPADDLDFGMIARRVLDQARDQQRAILHQAEHRLFPPRDRNCPASTGGHAFEAHFSIGACGVKRNAREDGQFHILENVCARPRGICLSRRFQHHVVARLQ